MNRPGDSDLSADAEMEVELSAQDLMGLTPPAAQSPTPAPVACAAPPLEKIAPGPAANTESVKQTAPARKRISRSNALRAAAVAAAVSLVAIVSVAELAPQQRAAIKHPVSNWTPVPDPVVMEEPEIEPMRVANPFDSKEVFELPAGTTEDEARAIVADMLLKRANERQVFSRDPR